MDKKDVFREKLKNGDAKPVERLLVSGPEGADMPS